MLSLVEKLHPNRFTEMSPFMAAIVGYVLGEPWTKPEIVEVTVSEAENLLYIRKAVRLFNLKISTIPGTRV